MSGHAIDATGGMLLGQRFRLVEVLGEGAMGAVWRATDSVTGDDVAVKLLHPHMAGDAGLAARFEREIAAGRRLAHRNVSNVVADGIEPCGRYMVMPLLTGHDLRRELGEGIGVRRTVAIARQVLAALEHVHGLGLVHRDVKPENLRLVPDAEGDERVVLIDFGLVRGAGMPADDRPLTQHGRVFGTPWYMAPEQAAGGTIDHRVDLYALGAVMFEMLTGKPPFDGTLVAVLHDHMYTDVPALPSWVPVELAELVARLLAKQPRMRPQTAREAAMALEAAVASVASRPTLHTRRTHAEPAFELGSAVDVVGAGRRPAPILERGGVGPKLAAATVAAAAAVALWFTAADPSSPAPADVVETIAADAIAPVAAPRVTVPATPSPAPTATPPVLAAVDTSPRAPAIDTPVVDAPVVDTPVVEPPSKPSRPSSTRPRPPRPHSKPDLPTPPREEPTRVLKPSKPPRTTSKVPGIDAQDVARNPDGSIRMRPRATA
jgi:serine/threonine-protein kinase